MNYDYSMLQPGDISLVKSNSLGGAGISLSFYCESELPWEMRREILFGIFKEDKNYPSNHNGIFCYYNENPVMIESVFEGVIPTPLEYYEKLIKDKKAEIIWARLVPELTPSEKQKIESFLIESLGTGYDFLSYVSHVWRITLRLPPLYRIESKSDVWCTQLGAKALEHINRNILNGWPTPYTVEKRIIEQKLEIVAHWHK